MLRSKFLFFLLVPFNVLALQNSACPILRVATHPNYPPFHFAEQNRLVGPSIELANKLADDLNIPIDVFPPMPWRRVLMKAKKGEIDIIVGLKKNEERLQYLDFSNVPVFENRMSVFVKKPNKSNINSWFDLIPKNGAISAGDRFGTEFDKYSDTFLQLSSVRGQAELVELLLRNRVDYIVGGHLTVSTILAENKNTDIAEAFTVNTGLIYLAVSKQSDCKQRLTEIDEKLLDYLTKQSFIYHPDLSL